MSSEGPEKKQNLQRDQAKVGGTADRPAETVGDWNIKATADTSKEIKNRASESKDRSWAQKEYRSLSPEARSELNSNINNIFTLRNPEFASGVKLDTNNPRHKEFIEKWLDIRDDLMTWKKEGMQGKSYWEAEAAHAKALHRDTQKTIDRVSRQSYRDLPAENRKPAKIMNETEHVKIKDALLEYFSRPDFDQVKAALNICRDLKADDIQNLKKTREGLNALLILDSVLSASSDKHAQMEAQRILFSDDSFPPTSLSPLGMSEGILREGYDGKGFLSAFQKECSEHRGEEATVALNFAKRMEKEHLLVAGQTLEGLKGLTEIRRLLAAGSFKSEDKAAVDDQLRRISEVLVPFSVMVESKSIAAGSLDRFGPGKELSNFIQNELSLKSRNDEAAINISKGLSDEALSAALGNEDGKKAIMSVYKILAENSDQIAQVQAKRILNSIEALNDPNRTEKRIEEGKVPIFPVSYTYFTSSVPFATLTDNGQVKIKLRNEIRTYDEFINETETIPSEVFLQGKEFKPEEIIGVKIYPEGHTVFRPAAYMLYINKLSVDFVTTVIKDVMMLGMGGPVGIGGRTTKGFFDFAGKVIDLSAITLWSSNLAVQESRGWLIDKYGEKGRRFAEVWDRASHYAEVYGMSKMATSVAGALVSSWKDLKTAGEFKDNTIFTRINQEIEAFEHSMVNARLTEAVVKVNKPSTTKPPEIRKSTSQPPLDDLVKSEVDAFGTTYLMETSIASKSFSSGPKTEVDPWKTFRSQRPGLMGYQEYLGQSLYSRARSFGMDNNTFFKYVDMNLYRGELLKDYAQGARVEIIKRNVQSALRDQLDQLDSIGAKADIQNAIRHGIDPDGIIDTIKTLKARGATDTQIRERLQGASEYVNYFRQEFCGNNELLAKSSIRAAEGVEQAVSSAYWTRKVSEWNTANPTTGPGAERLKQWGNEASAFARQRTRQYIGRE
jgi:hypothetical protein